MYDNGQGNLLPEEVAVRRLCRHLHTLNFFPFRVRMLIFFLFLGVGGGGRVGVGGNMMMSGLLPSGVAKS